MKRFASLTLSLCLITSIFSTSAKSSEIKHSLIPSVATHTVTEVYRDSSGNFIKLEYSSLGSDTLTYIYVNGTLTQAALISSERNEVIYEEYPTSENGFNIDSSSPSVQRFTYSEFATDVQNIQPEEEANNTPYATLSAWNPDGWGFLTTYPPTSWITGSSEVKMYVLNADEEPNLHKYMQRDITLGAGTPIAIAIGLVVQWATASLSPLNILSLIGASILGDVITNYISAEVCYSTQKILYAPVIKGINIFPNAYITKRFLITYDYTRGREKSTLVDESYDYNKGQTPYDIAVNAQAASYIYFPEDFV